MSTASIETTLVERPLVVALNQTGYARYKIPIPNIPTQAGDSVSSVTMTNAGTLYTQIPNVVFTSATGAGAAGTARMKVLSAVVTTPQSGSGSYAPGNTITLAETTAATQPILTITHTLVQSAAVAAGGTGGTPGTQTVTGTTGTGTKFQASVTVSGGGAITAILSITVAGDYTVNPTLLTAEPVTGASLTGATLNIKMGVLTTTISTAGVISALASAPVPQGSTTGSGTGATFTCTYGVDSVLLSSGGADYATPPTVSFPGADGSGAAATAVISGVNDPVTVSLEFSDELPNDEYALQITPGMACVPSYDNKTTLGCDIILTPLDGATLSAGTVDVNILFTA